MWATPVLWPDFEVKDLDDALRSYAERERRFGR
jgi:undecaprenyl diphosphate synthase